MNTQLIVIDAGATRHWSPQPIPERFFGGTKENISRICNEIIPPLPILCWLKQA
jgi:hypothetical protein